jgi:3-methylornithyl-N6-L-lysine dehydrogenase
MTRLTPADVALLPQELDEIDAALCRATARGIGALGRLGASGLPDLPVGPSGPGTGQLVGIEVAVVPVTVGKGLLAGFAQAVAAVAGFIGCSSRVTAETDVAGLAAAAEERARLVLLADDTRFICLDLLSGRLADNGEATGCGYAAALANAILLRSPSAGGAGRGGDRPVLVLGLGPVGRAAARWLVEADFEVLVYDPEPVRAAKAARERGIHRVLSPEEGLRRTEWILDASPAAGILDDRSLSSCAIVAAPGIPCGVGPAGAARLGDRLVHEPLALGVSTMLHMALKSSGDPGG